MNKAIVTILSCVLAGSWALAAPLVTTEIPDSAIWAAHVDAEAITASAVAKGMLALITAEGAPVPAEGVAKALEGWKQLHNVKSLTLYGSSPDETDAVAVAKLKYDEAEIRKLANITEDTPADPHGDRVIYTLLLKSKRAPDGVKRFGCFHSEEIIVVGGDLKKVQEALDLLDGKGKALTSENPLKGMLAANKGSFMVAAVADMPTMLKAIRERAAAVHHARQKGPPAALLAKAQAARAEVGEAEGNVFASLELTMATEEDAQNVNLFIQGMRALALLHRDRQKDDPIKQEVFKLVQAIKAGPQGSTVAVQFQYPAKDLLALMDKLMALRAAMQAKKAAEGANE